MKYIFPRQFGLHNVFTSKVDLRETVQPFKDYTLREQEITNQEQQLKRKAPHHNTIDKRIPKRLRGECLSLVQNLQKRNQSCSYNQVLNHYCPATVNDLPQISRFRDRGHPKVVRRSKQARTSSIQKLEDTGQPTSTAGNSRNRDDRSGRVAHSDIPGASKAEKSYLDLASPHSQVSAFCRASLSALIPKGFWGVGEAGIRNQSIVMKNIDRFVRLRRFESFSLHAAFQGIKVWTPNEL